MERYSIYISIKSNDEIHNLEKHDLIFDINNRVGGVFKREKVNELFDEEFASLAITSYTIEGCNHTLTSADLVIEDDYIVIKSFVDFTDSSLEYRLFLSNNIITVECDPKGNTQYEAIFYDDIFYRYSFHESVRHIAKNKKVKLKLIKMVENVEVTSIEKDIVINDNKSISINDDYSIESYKNVSREYFQNGKENRSSFDKIVPVATDIFDLNVYLTKTQNYTDYIYPVVEATYIPSIKYTYNEYKNIGEGSYNASITESTSAGVSVLKYYCSTINVSATFECSCRYIQNNTYMTSTLSHNFSGSVNLFNYSRVSDSKEVVIDIEQAEKDIVGSKSIYSMFMDSAAAKGISNPSMYSYKIKNISITVDGRSSECAKIAYRVINSDIDLSAPPIVTLFPYNAVFTGFNTFYANGIIDDTPICNDNLITAMHCSSQNDEKYTGINYRYQIYKLYGEVSINATTVIAKAKKPRNEEGSFNVENGSVVIRLSHNSDAVASVTVIPTKKCYVGSELIDPLQNKKLILNSKDDGLSFCISPYLSTIVKEKEVIGRDSRISCNGVATTYETSLKGKEDRTISEKPINIPHFATSFKPKIEIVDVFPVSAKENVNFSFRDGDNIKELSNITMSSDYRTSINKSIEKEHVHSQKGLKLKQNQVKKFNVSFKCSNGTQEIYISSSENSISFDYPRIVNVTGGICNIEVTAYATIGANSAWYPSIKPTYYYINSNEYYMYNESIEISSKGNISVIDYIPKNIAPICVKSDGINLTRVTANHNNIYIKEEITSIPFYTKYNDINIISVKKDNDFISYTSGKNHVISEIGSFVTYKVNNSFDYEFKDGKTYIYTSDSNKLLSIYIENNNIIASDINPLTTGISSGYIYISNNDEVLSSAVCYMNKIGDYYNAIIHLYDQFDNNYTNEAFADGSIQNGNTLSIKYINIPQSITVVSGDTEIIISEGDFLY